jgi:choline dehydrogenase-like flavoprotein
MGKDVETSRAALRTLLYNKISFKKIVSVITKLSILKVAFGLLSERFGFGFFTKIFIISMQLEQVPKKNSKVFLSSDCDKFNRRIPEIHQQISDDALLDIHNIQNQIGNMVRNGAKFSKFEVKAEDVLPGAHYSGTCRMGLDKNSSVVDPDLCYHGLKNLYVCDASVIPKIGNANLTFTIAAFALRLADYLTIHSDGVK